MTDPRAYTPNMEAVREVADRALNTGPDGLTLYFRTPKFPLSEGKRRAQSFQQSFSSLRNRARRMSKEDKLARDHNAVGPYDRLACIRGELADGGGWYVKLLPGTALFDDLEIVDNATGQLIDMGAGRSEGQILLDRAIEHSAGRSKAGLTPAEWDRLTELWPTMPGGQATSEPWHVLMGDIWYPRPSDAQSTPSASALSDTDLQSLAKSGDIFGEDE